MRKIFFDPFGSKPNDLKVNNNYLITGDRGYFEINEQGYDTEKFMSEYVV